MTPMRLIETCRTKVCVFGELHFVRCTMPDKACRSEDVLDVFDEVRGTAGYAVL